MRALLSSFVAMSCVLGGSSASAEVVASSESGFVSHNEAEVTASPAEAWDMLLRPSEWWNGAHTYSGSAANMMIDPEPGGCFCERIPGIEGGPDGQIEHMRVLLVIPGSMLRMRGGLGPLQSEAVTAVLTMTVEPAGAGAKIAWDYVVGGYMRMSHQETAPLVDRVIGEQLIGLAERLGPN